MKKAQMKNVLVLLVVVVIAVLGAIIYFLFGELQSIREDQEDTKALVQEAKDENERLKGDLVKQQESSAMLSEQFKKEVEKLENLSENLFEKVKNSIVLIKTAKGHGSGFFIDSQGTIMTNAHVIDKVIKNVEISSLSNPKFFAEVTAIDRKNDLAILKAKGRISQPIETADAYSIGEKIFSLGFPRAGNDFNDIAIKEGIIARKFIEDGATLGLEVTSEIAEGMSGGPTVNADGELIGVNRLLLRSSRGSDPIKVIIPLEIIKQKTSGLISQDNTLVYSKEIGEIINIKGLEGLYYELATLNNTLEERLDITIEAIEESKKILRSGICYSSRKAAPTSKIQSYADRYTSNYGSFEEVDFQLIEEETSIRRKNIEEKLFFLDKLPDRTLGLLGQIERNIDKHNDLVKRVSNARSSFSSRAELDAYLAKATKEEEGLSKRHVSLCNAIKSNINKMITEHNSLLKDLKEVRKEISYL